MNRLSLVLAVVALAPCARAQVTYGFGCISFNSSTNCAVGESQLKVTVSDAGGGLVKFRFTNNVGIASSITDIYFDDGDLVANRTLLAVSSVAGGGGATFTNVGVTPPNLPSGNTVNFDTTAGFSADSGSPAVPNGVNSATRFADIIFSLQPGKNFQSVLDALALGFANPGVDTATGLRIGIHVQGFASNGGSEAFVATPEPRFYGLLSVCLAGLFFAARRRRVADGIADPDGR
jgi:hypothetical protein